MSFSSFFLRTTPGLPLLLPGFLLDMPCTLFPLKRARTPLSPLLFLPARRRPSCLAQSPGQAFVTFFPQRTDPTKFLVFGEYFVGRSLLLPFLDHPSTLIFTPKCSWVFPLSFSLRINQRPLFGSACGVLSLSNRTPSLSVSRQFLFSTLP